MIALVSGLSEDYEDRARSFGLVAEAYHRYRPELPEAALDWLLPLDCQKVLDLGAGTGAATRVLARRVPEVIAVEPNERMREVLSRQVPGARVLKGRAEAIPLADGSVDAVMVCSAWHWMDPHLAVPEIARVLRPRGVWGILWNSLDREESIGANLRGLTRQPDPEERRLRARRPENVWLPEDSPFAPPETALIGWTWTISVDDLLGLVGTRSSVILLDTKTRAELLAQVRALVETQYLSEDGRTVEVPMGCRCWKALRL